MSRVSYFVHCIERRRNPHRRKCRRVGLWSSRAEWSSGHAWGREIARRRYEFGREPHKGRKGTP